MIYAIFLCSYGVCSLVMGQDMFPPHSSSVRENCLYWAEDYSRGLGSKRGPDYEFRCAARSEPWGVVGDR